MKCPTGWTGAFGCGKFIIFVICVSHSCVFVARIQNTKQKLKNQVQSAVKKGGSYSQAMTRNVLSPFQVRPSSRRREHRRGRAASTQTVPATPLPFSTRAEVLPIAGSSLLAARSARMSEGRMLFSRPDPLSRRRQQVSEPLELAPFHLRPLWIARARSGCCPIQVNRKAALHSCLVALSHRHRSIETSRSTRPGVRCAGECATGRGLAG